MKIDIKDIFDALQELQNQQGNLKLFIAILLTVVLGVLIVYLKYYTKSIAEEASKKSLAEFERNLSDKLQTQIGLFFRDDNVRTNLLTHIGTKSIEKKMNVGKQFNQCILNTKRVGIFQQRLMFKNM